MGYDFIVRRPLPAKEGWAWLRSEEGGAIAKRWVRLEWPSLWAGDERESIEAGAGEDLDWIEKCTFNSDPSLDFVDPTEGEKLYGIRIVNTHLLQCKHMYVKEEEERGVWVAALRKHSVHHDVNNGFDVSKRVIGSGSFAQVFLATDLVSRSKVALKVIRKHRLDEGETKMLADEVRISQMVSHTNVVVSSEFIESFDSYILVMEYVAGGDLFSQVASRPSEAVVREYARQILCGLTYMHTIGICHRDIKPENLLLTATHPVTVKLADFGSSIDVSPDNPDACLVDKDRLQCSPGYGAPEIIHLEPYGLPCDLWSLGATLYFLLTSVQPFTGETEDETRELMHQGVYDHKLLDSFSHQIQSLISVLLDKEPSTRATVDAASKHEWFVQTQDELSQNKSPHATSAASPPASGLFACFGIFSRSRKVHDQSWLDGGGEGSFEAKPQSLAVRNHSVAGSALQGHGIFTKQHSVRASSIRTSSSGKSIAAARKRSSVVVAALNQNEAAKNGAGVNQRGDGAR
uniref:Protein kinase domain-containing protein n=1 Tax=Hemiselmis tepida TaxID=464990 RepID=A0A7S0VXE6_9CRYP|mmetsp:Transcript_29630/g.75060  ORF Transcript_29630/g.75060 Transcript_29630/m.75060 type:complete len:518 (+) Transcript_29630:105-1658(+)